MGYLIVGGVVLLVAVVIYLYLSTIAASRRSTDRLYEAPDDMKRADDNQQPPFNGSSGWV